MNISDYLKDKKLLIIFAVIQALLAVALFFIFNINKFILIPLLLIILGLNFLYLFFDFRKRRDFYDNFLMMMNVMENPQDAISKIEKPGFFEGDALCSTAEFLKNSRIAEIDNQKNLYIPFLTKFEQEIKSAENDDYRNILAHEYSIFTRAIKNDTENNVSEIRSLLFEAIQSNRKELLNSNTTVSVKNIKHTIIADQNIFTDILILVLIHAYKDKGTAIKFYCESAPEPCLTAEYSTMVGDTLPLEIILIEILCMISKLKFRMFQSDHTYIKIFYPLSDVPAAKAGQLQDDKTTYINPDME